jgi:hypothetical protein
MSKFKIRIYCTKKEELLYNNHRISVESNKDFDKINFNKIEYIDSCSVLYKYKKKFLIKILEFEINKNLNINEIKEFITILKTLNFKSENDTVVHYIDITNNQEHIYIYKLSYNTLNINKEKNKKKKLKKYNYITIPLYKRIKL